MDINSPKRTLILEILKRHTVKHTTKRCTKSCRTQDAARSLTTLTKIGTLHIANGWRGLKLRATTFRNSTKNCVKAINQKIVQVANRYASLQEKLCDLLTVVNRLHLV